MYNPQFVRGFGVGAINGALWTISVELQFYVLTPIVYRLMRTHHNAVLLVTFFVAINAAYLAWPHHNLPFAPLSLTFAPWFYMRG